MSLLSILFFLALYLPAVAPSLESTGNTRLTVGFVEPYISSRGSEHFNYLKTPRLESIVLSAIHLPPSFSHFT